MSENGWRRCLNRPAAKHTVYKQPEHNVMGTDGIVWKRSCQKQRWFGVGSKKSRMKLTREAMKSLIQSLTVTFLLNGRAIHSQLIYSAFNIAK